jgi:DNA-directed RNA polymerase subunit K/omega
VFPVDRSLYADVSTRFDLKVATARVAFEVVGQGPLYVARPGVMTLYEIAVVAVHHADQVRQAARRAWMQILSEAGRRAHHVADHVGQLDRVIFQQTGLQTTGVFSSVHGCTAGLFR